MGELDMNETQSMTRGMRPTFATVPSTLTGPVEELVTINPAEYGNPDVPTEPAFWSDRQVIYAIPARDTTGRPVFLALTVEQMRGLAVYLTARANALDKVKATRETGEQ